MPRASLFGTLAGGGAVTPISLVAHTSAVSPGGGGTITSSGIDTTGATMLVVGVVRLAVASITISDSKSNTWTPLTTYTSLAGTSPPAIQLFYAKNPTVGTGHTFASNGSTQYGNLYVQAFTNVDPAADADGDVGHQDTPAATIQPGALLPSRNNSVVVELFVAAADGTISINGSFTITDKVESDVNNFKGGMAYYVQSTAASANPTWTTTMSPGALVAAQTSFFLS